MKKQHFFLDLLLEMDLGGRRKLLGDRDYLTWAEEEIDLFVNKMTNAEKLYDLGFINYREMIAISHQAQKSHPEIFRFHTMARNLLEKRN